MAYYSPFLKDWFFERVNSAEREKRRGETDLSLAAHSPDGHSGPGLDPAKAGRSVRTPRLVQGPKDLDLPQLLSWAHLQGVGWEVEQVGCIWDAGTADIGLVCSAEGLMS